MSRRFVWPTAAVLALGAVSRVPVYFGHEAVNQLQVLWRQDKAYICAGRAVYGGRVSLGGGLWCVFRGYFAPRWCSADRKRRDLLVVEVDPGGVKQRALQGFPSGGGCHVFGGVLHYGIGVSDPAEYPADWRWDGQEFVRLPKEEALQQRATYRYWSDLHEKEGWQAKEFWKDGETFAFELAGTSAAVRIDRPWPPGTQRVFLRLGKAQSEKPLLTIEEKTRRISATQYWSLPPEPTLPSRRH